MPPPRRVLLHNQIGRLFLSIEKRATAQKLEHGGGGVTPGVDTDDGLGFKIHVVGDSTMRVKHLSCFSLADFAKKMFPTLVSVFGLFANQVEPACRQSALNRSSLPSAKLVCPSER